MDNEKIFKQLSRYAESESGKDYIKKHLLRYIETIKILPNKPKLKILDIGTFIPLAGWLRKNTKHSYTFHGLWEGRKVKTIRNAGEYFKLYNFNVEKDRLPFSNETFDLVMCCEVLEHLGLDPMLMISEINRVLKPKGRLILTTPNICSLRNLSKMVIGYSPYLYASFTLTPDRHNREYSVREVRSLLDHGGFKLQKLFTKNVYFDKDKVLKGLNFFIRTGFKIFLKIPRLSNNRDDCIFVVARKSGSVKERYPLDFYDILDHQSH